MNNSGNVLREMFGNDLRYMIGNDIVFLPDFCAMLNTVFIEKVFTAAEKEYAYQFATPSLRFASTFSVKEAVYKAVKQWYPKKTLAFDKIEILRDRPAGKPRCTLHYPALAHLNLSISITHDGDYVWAMALVSNQAKTDEEYDT